jgi:hypothetical protein
VLATDDRGALDHIPPDETGTFPRRRNNPLGQECQPFLRPTQVPGHEPDQDKSDREAERAPDQRHRIGNRYGDEDVERCERDEHRESDPLLSSRKWEDEPLPVVPVDRDEVDPGCAALAAGEQRLERRKPSGHADQDDEDACDPVPPGEEIDAEADRAEPYERQRRGLEEAERRNRIS